MRTRQQLNRFLPFVRNANSVADAATFKFKRSSESDGGRLVSIIGETPKTQVPGLQLRPTAARKRTGTRKDVTGFYLDNGIFNFWNYRGTRESDTLELGSTGTIITKGLGGIFKMGKDSAPDKFVFTNTINVARQSEIFGRPISRYNHLAGVKIYDFGKEDVINIQGDVYRWKDINKRDGTIPGIEPARLQVYTQTY